MKQHARPLDPTNTGSQAWLVAAVNAIRRDHELTSSQKLVLYTLAGYCDAKGQCYPGLDRLVLDTGFATRRVIARILEQLERLGRIRRTRRRLPRAPGSMQTGDITTLYEVRVPASLVGASPRVSQGHTVPVSLGHADGVSQGHTNVPISDLSETSPLLLPTNPPRPPPSGGSAAVSEKVLEQARRLFAPERGELSAARAASGMRAVIAIEPPPSDDELVAFLAYQHRHRDVSGSRFPLAVVCNEHDFRVWRVRVGRQSAKAEPKQVAGERGVAKVPIVDPRIAKAKPPPELAKAIARATVIRRERRR